MPEYLTDISHDDLLRLPVASIGVPVTVIDSSFSQEDIQACVSRLRESKVLGLDTETKPSFSKGKINKVALLQLSSRSECVIVRLSTFERKTPLRPIRRLIESSAVVKAGVGIADDARTLLTDWGWRPSAILELCDLSERKGLLPHSLAKIYALLFGERIPKAQRLSDWEREQLTTAQIEYAALDAWAGYRIYEALYDEYTPQMLRSEFKPFVRKKNKTLRKRPCSTDRHTK